MKKIIFIISILILFPLVSSAQVLYPEKKQEYVNDFTNVLGDTSSLEAEIEKFEKNTSSRINITVLNTLEDASIDRYADKLYDKWRVGRDKDDGVLIVVCLQDKKIYIKVGYGLLSTVTSEINQNIIENEISPSFQESMYLEGLEKGNKALMAAILGEYKMGNNEKNKYSSLVFVVILVSVFIFLFIFSNIKLKKKKIRGNLGKIRNI